MKLIAHGQQKQLTTALSRFFFSLQADGNTDTGNIEDELFLVLFLIPTQRMGRYTFVTPSLQQGTLAVERAKSCLIVCREHWSTWDLEQQTGR